MTTVNEAVGRYSTATTLEDQVTALLEANAALSAQLEQGRRLMVEVRRRWDLASARADAAEKELERLRGLTGQR